MSNSYMPSKTKSDTHITPDSVFQLIKKHWGYDKHEMFDPCPPNCHWDGLTLHWKGLNFVNPPYTLLRQFVRKAIEESIKNDNHSIMLLPAKTDQQWFHDILTLPDYDILWIRKRLKFANHKWHAPQPHFLVKL